MIPRAQNFGFRWDAPINGKYRQVERAVPRLASTSQVLRRTLMSTTGEEEADETPGRLMIEPMLAIPMHRDASLRKQ